MIASKYAIALYNISKKRDTIQETLNYLKILYSLLENEKLKILLESPSLSNEEKKSILSKVGLLDDMIIDFLLFLLKRGNFYQLPKIMQAFNKIYYEEKNILVVKIYTSKALSKEFRNILLKLLEKKLKSTIELDELVDKNLLGGMRIEFKDKVIDTTYKNYLDNIISLVKGYNEN